MANLINLEREYEKVIVIMIHSCFFVTSEIISVSSLINLLVCPPNRTSRFVLGIGSTLQIGRQHPMVTLR